MIIKELCCALGGFLYWIYSKSKRYLKRVVVLLWDLSLSLLVTLIVVTVIFSIVYALMIARGWLLTDNMNYFMDGVVFTAIVSTVYDLVAKKIRKAKVNGILGKDTR
jgi:ABC-type Co2+ transport system permease subunit